MSKLKQKKSADVNADGLESVPTSSSQSVHPDKGSSPRSNRRSKLRKNFNKRSQSSSGSKTSTVETGFPHANDPAWRVQNPALSETVGNILFSDPTGLFHENNVYPLDITATTALSTTKWAIAGLMVFNALPLWGEATSATAPTNIAGQKIQWLANVKWYNSVGYAPSDIMAMIMAVDSIHIFIIQAIRAYACCSKYSVQNKYLGRTLVRALGWDYDDIIQNLARFRYVVNEAITKVNQLHIPKVFYCVDSHIAMYSRIYTESPTLSEKSQLYAFRSNSTWVWNDADGTLTAKPWQWWTSSTSKHVYCTVSDFENTISAMLDPILTSEFIAKMDSDLLRVFSYDECFQLSPIGETLDIQFTYDPLVLCQIFNAEFVNAALSDYSNNTKTAFDITQAGTVPIATGSLLDDELPYALFAQYSTHLGARTDLLSGSIKLKGYPTGSSRGEAQYLAQSQCIPHHCVGPNAHHYFNILDILPKSPAVILEAAHYKFNLGITNVSGLTGTASEYELIDFQDALIFGIQIYNFADKSNLGTSGLLPQLMQGGDIKADTCMQYVTSSLKNLWQFSMPPMTFIWNYQNKVTHMFSELQDIYVASKKELANFNFVSVQSMWDPERLPKFRNGGSSMR